MTSWLHLHSEGILKYLFIADTSFFVQRYRMMQGRHYIAKNVKKQKRSFVKVKGDAFNFNIKNFPFLSSNIPSSPTYRVFISQLIRYDRACSSYECFILRAARLYSKLLRQGYIMERLKSSLRKFYGQYGDLLKHYRVSLSQMLHGIMRHDHIR